MIRVVLADDQALVREGLALILSTQDDIKVVGEAADGDEALAVVRRERPDVVLMDIRMPGTDGLDATRRLLSGPATGTRVLVATTFDLDEYVYEALRAGASGFLLKMAPRAHLLHAVRTVADGHSLLDPAMTRLVERFVRRPPPSGAVPEVLRRLTPGSSTCSVRSRPGAPTPRSRRPCTWARPR